ncbi:molybdopterin-binding protein [uncultured Tateyamaria sp.]|uniref:molybdopterin-binding protein n=1 Tax=uncultured Tateyamaria sp. TaxID=455651 RepID=UPI002628E951|nr:molybdopterin-binding protein [uncultured Tateyamaria sp.]
MIFGPVETAAAAGAILAHSMPVPGGRIPKGTTLTPDHLRALAEAGYDQIVVAQLQLSDVEENTAAARLAAAFAPTPEHAGLRISAAGAGRVNLYATGPGVVRLNVEAVDRVNAVDPMITLATVSPWHRVEAGTMIATIKIISYAVPETALIAACAAAPGAISVVPPQFQTATLIETQVGEATPNTKGRDALTGRLDRLGLTLSGRCVVAHEVEALAHAVAQASGQVVFVLTASATSDTYDVAPEALRAAGGQVTAFGLPVDPGNLLFFGQIDARPVIGLPGCARSPALNGADWVLERLICGIALGQQDISAMGVGGLLKEIPSRPRPRSA